MSRIRGSNTKIEITVRHALHAQGLRYRLDGAGLVGRPDLVFPRHGTVLFVNGCFWHGHHCHLFRLPKTRTEFWDAKIEGNRLRDARVAKELRKLGWRPLVIWECELRGKTDVQRSARLNRLSKQIRNMERSAN
jgi:DNA mismatch endonuclease (patch repair protein)